MTNLPKALRAELAERAYVRPFDVVKRQVDPEDDTRKYLLRARDGELTESVMMTHEHGRSVCISSQVGCAQGCAFCASTVGGLVRNLSTAELVAQPYSFARELPEDQRISSVVFMGMGEPLENYENVLRTVKLLHDPHGMNMGYRHMTLSTVGIVPAMERLMEEELPVTLAVSLHAPTNELRSRLVPLNREYPLEDLIAVSRAYASQTGRRVSFEYVLVRGINDGLTQARQLVKLLEGFLSHVNLIPYNPVPGRPWDRPEDEVVRAFRLELEKAGIPTTIRRTLGVEIDAACGQLRRRESVKRD
jgi:23S rRNA (adenine2503-C2)-methyltransferase